MIASAQQGSADAYQALLEAYGSRLYGYFYHATRRHHDAEDLLSELMLRLVRRLPEYDHRGRFDQWLFRIAANMVRDWIRRRRARPSAMSISSPDDSAPSVAETMAGPAPPVDAGVLAAEASSALQAALERLGEPTRQMILLRHFGEMSYKDIAAMFACPVGTVLARVHRGLRALRQLMENDHGTQ